MTREDDRVPLDAQFSNLNMHDSGGKQNSDKSGYGYSSPAPPSQYYETLPSQVHNFSTQQAQSSSQSPSHQQDYDSSQNITTPVGAAASYYGAGFEPSSNGTSDTQSQYFAGQRPSQSYQQNSKYSYSNSSAQPFQSPQQQQSYGEHALLSQPGQWQEQVQHYKQNTPNGQQNYRQDEPISHVSQGYQQQQNYNQYAAPSQPTATTTSNQNINHNTIASPGYNHSVYTPQTNSSEFLNTVDAGPTGTNAGLIGPEAKVKEHGESGRGETFKKTFGVLAGAAGKHKQQKNKDGKKEKGKGNAAAGGVGGVEMEGKYEDEGDGDSGSDDDESDSDDQASRRQRELDESSDDDESGDDEDEEAEEDEEEESSSEDEDEE